MTMFQNYNILLIFYIIIINIFKSSHGLPAFEIVPPMLQPENEENDNNKFSSWVYDMKDSSNNNLEWMLMPGSNGEVHLAVLTDQPATESLARMISPNDVEFFLFTRENRDGPERAYYKTSCKPEFEFFNPNRETKMLVHGFGDSIETSLMYPLLVNAFLDRDDVNVFVIDWARLAGTPWYRTAVGNTEYVGARAARMIDHLINSTGADLKDFHVVGFSLGSHIAGIIGNRVTSGKVARITGLDPASVLYSSAPLENRLDASDAEYVEIIHTSGGYLGYTDPIGQVDFFPNGGTWPQPGCYMDFVAVCSHRRAYYYFAEALTSDHGFRAVACDTYSHFEDGQCSDHKILYLGSDHLPMEADEARGNYFLDTNDGEPYARSFDQPILNHRARVV